MLADRDQAEDAAQEVFAVACRDIGSLKSKDRFAAWLAAICRDASAEKSETDTLANRTARLFVAGLWKWEIAFLKPSEQNR